MVICLTIETLTCLLPQGIGGNDRSVLYFQKNETFLPKSLAQAQHILGSFERKWHILNEVLDRLRHSLSTTLWHGQNITVQAL